MFLFTRTGQDEEAEAEGGTTSNKKKKKKKKKKPANGASTAQGIIMLTEKKCYTEMQKPGLYDITLYNYKL